MASVQFDGGKLHGATEAKAMMRHACADERVRHTHSNIDIDTDKTKQNSDLHGMTYVQMCAAYDARIATYRAASKRALRKDAVTLYDAIVTVPRDLPEDQEDQWYRDVEQTINAHYGATVVLDAKIHRDERHTYTDPDTGKTVMSRTHAHVFMFPEVDGRLCAKSFSSRKNMMTLNHKIDEMSRNRYNVAFLTDEKSVDRNFQTVEQLKQTSDAAALSRQVEENREALAQVRQDLETARDDLAGIEHEMGILNSAEIKNGGDVKPAFLRPSRVVADRDYVAALQATAAAIDNLDVVARKQAQAAAEQEAKDRTLASREQALKQREALVQQQEQDLGRIPTLENRIHQQQQELQQLRPLERIQQVFPDHLANLALILRMQDHWRDLRAWRGADLDLGSRAYASTIFDGIQMTTQDFINRYKAACGKAGVSPDHGIMIWDTNRDRQQPTRQHRHFRDDMER